MNEENKKENDAIKEQYLINLFSTQEDRSESLHDLIDQVKLVDHNYFYFKQGYCLRDGEIESLQSQLKKKNEALKEIRELLINLSPYNIVDFHHDAINWLEKYKEEKEK